MTVTALVPWYGSNRASASMVGELLGKRDWVGVPFLGSGTELRGIECRAGVANDLHSHLINLAMVVRRPALLERLAHNLILTPFHDVELVRAQKRLRAREAGRPVKGYTNLNWARDYFVAAWMTRSADAGTGKELSGLLALRWTSSGGDSAVRYRAAVDALTAWCDLFQRWSFTLGDGVAFCRCCKDLPRHALYADPPWRGPGDKYTFTMTDEQHKALADVLGWFKKAAVLLRIGDDDFSRALYPLRLGWTWRSYTTRSQANKPVREALVSRNIDAG